jgi:hypothetical protein
MIWPFLFFAHLSYAATPPPVIAQIEQSVAQSQFGRRLLVAAGEVSRRETHSSGLRFAIDVRGGESPELVIDLARTPKLPPGEAQAEYALSLSKAAIASPIALVEVEQACWQNTALVLMEMALSDATISKALREAEQHSIPGADVLNKAAAYLARFEAMPEDAWWRIESGADLPRGAVRLTDLEDLFTLHGLEIRDLPKPPQGHYVDFNGRRYLSTLIGIAYFVRAPGTLERLREALGAYDTVGVLTFRTALVGWRRSLGRVPPGANN